MWKIIVTQPTCWLPPPSEMSSEPSALRRCFVNIVIVVVVVIEVVIEVVIVVVVVIAIFVIIVIIC